MESEIEDESIYEFYNRGIEMDDNLGFLCVLDKANAPEEKLEWLKAHPKARYYGILDKISEI